MFFILYIALLLHYNRDIAQRNSREYAQRGNREKAHCNNRELVQ